MLKAFLCYTDFFSGNKNKYLGTKKFLFDEQCFTSHGLCNIFTILYYVYTDDKICILSYKSTKKNSVICIEIKSKSTTH